MTDPLDVETEALIDKAIYSGCTCMVPGMCRYCTSNRAALRSRIRELIEQARKLGQNQVIDTYRIPASNLPQAIKENEAKS